MNFVQRHPGLRWLVPVTALGLVLGAPLLQNGATAAPGLQPRTAEQLLSDLASAKPVALSGTVRQQVDLGLPTLPQISAQSAIPDPLSLVNGTNTWRVWTNADKLNRVALLQGRHEVNLISNPTQTWLWNSATREAVKFDHDQASEPEQSPEDKPLIPSVSPEQAAREVLEAITPSTTVSTTTNTIIAGREAYQLVLEPKTPGTKVGRAIIAIDGENKMPLRVQVFATNTTTPAIDIGFTELTLGVPAASVFRFTPPKGATVLTPEQFANRHLDKDDPGTTSQTPQPRDKPDTDKPGRKGKQSADDLFPTITGNGWSQVVVLPGPPLSTDDPALGQVLQQMPRVSGDWGKGRLWNGTLISAVITEDGRIALGAVEPSLLYAALR